MFTDSTGGAKAPTSDKPGDDWAQGERGFNSAVQAAQANQPGGTPTATGTPAPTSTPTATSTPTPTNTPTATNTPTSTPTNTPTATSTPTSTPTATPTPTPPPTPVPVPAPTPGTGAAGRTVANTVPSLATAAAGFIAMLTSGGATLYRGKPNPPQPYQAGNSTITSPALIEKSGQLSAPVPVPTPWGVQPMQGYKVKAFDTSMHAGIIAKPGGIDGNGPFVLFPKIGASSTPLGMNVPGGFVQVGGGYDDKGRATYVYAGTFSQQVVSPDIASGNAGPLGGYVKDSGNQGFQLTFHTVPGPGNSVKVEQVDFTASVGTFAQAGFDIGPKAGQTYFGGAAGYASGSLNYLTVELTPGAPKGKKPEDEPEPAPDPVPVPVPVPAQQPEKQPDTSPSSGIPMPSGADVAKGAAVAGGTALVVIGGIAITTEMLEGASLVALCLL